MIYNIPTDMIYDNPWQPPGRSDGPVDDIVASLEAHAASHPRTQGLLQVPAGRWIDPETGKLKDVTTFGPTEDLTPEALRSLGAVVQLAYGHRRLAAFRQLGRTTMPVDVGFHSDAEMAAMAWTENNDRDDLNPLDEAQFIEKYVADFDLTQAQAAGKLRMSRESLANKLRLTGLPEDLKPKLADRTLSERQAIRLLELFALPESIRAKGENGWNSSQKPSGIVRDALAGVSSDEITRRIHDLVKTYGRMLSSAGWKLTEEFSEDGLRSAACKGCEMRANQNICLDPACYDRKVHIFKARQIQAASQASGIPVYIGEMSYHQLTDFRYGSAERDFKSTIQAAGCQNLRLVPNQNGKSAPHPEGFDDVEIFCQKRSGYCTCLKGLEMQRELERRQAQQAAAQPAPVIEQPQGKLLIEVFDPVYDEPTAQDLEDLARMARQEKRQVNKHKDALAKLFADRIAAGLVVADVNTLRLVAGRELSYRFHDDEAMAWDLDRLAQEIGEYVANKALPYEPKSQHDVLRHMNDVLKTYGLPLIELPAEDAPSVVPTSETQELTVETVTAGIQAYLAADSDLNNRWKAVLDWIHTLEVHVPTLDALHTQILSIDDIKVSAGQNLDAEFKFEIDEARQRLVELLKIVGHPDWSTTEFNQYADTLFGVPADDANFRVDLTKAPALVLTYVYTLVTGTDNNSKRAAAIRKQLNTLNVGLIQEAL